ncbi:MAG: STAS domain-containing protein [Bacillota bacterium]
MTSKFNIASSTFPSLITASKRIFQSIAERLDVNTVYVTQKGPNVMTVLSSYNEADQIIPEGYSVEYGGTYCRLIIMNEKKHMNSVDLTKDILTKELEVTSQLETKGFLGVTLSDLQGNVFGTLCVMDRQEKNFNESDINFLKSMAGLLSHIIELDRTKFNMAFLQNPIIPITNGVSVLPIQGVIDEERAQLIIYAVLEYCNTHQIEYFTIDLSGLIIIDGQFPKIFAELIQSLQLMGIESILTGITPDMARFEVANGHLTELATKKVRNLESALDYIGFTLIEKI